MKRKGFTLVELSIVLVIIGLLIGGILVAQSMIQTTKQQRFISSLEKYGVAIMNFQAAYKQIPGDSSLFLPAGNNNRTMETPATCSVSSPAYSANEQTNAWGHLSQAKMLDVNYSSYSPTTCAGGVHNATYENSANAGIVWPFTDGHNSLFVSSMGTDKYPLIITASSGLPGITAEVEPKMMAALTEKLGAVVAPANVEQGRYYTGYPVGQCLFGAAPFGLGSCMHASASFGILIYIPYQP